MGKMTKPEAEFYGLWITLQRSRHAGLEYPEPVREHPFHAARAWRLDFCWPAAMVAVEIEGGVFLRAGGRHNLGAGMAADAEKYNAAVFLGWSVIRLTDKQLKPQPIRYTTRGQQSVGSGTNPVDLLENIARLIRDRILDRPAARDVNSSSPRSFIHFGRTAVPPLAPGEPPFSLR